MSRGSVLAIVVVAFLAFVAGGRFAKDPAPSDRDVDRNELHHAKVETWRELYRGQDADGLQRFLLEDFVLIDAEGGVSSKAQEVAWLRANPWSGGDFLYTVEDIAFVGRDAAIVYGHGDSTSGDAEGVPCRRTYWSSNVFVRVEGEWHPTFSHVSGVRCDPIDDAGAG